MEGSRADVGEAEPFHQLADRALVVVAEALLDHCVEIDPPPAHDVMDIAVGTHLDDGGELRELLLNSGGAEPFAQ